MTQAFGRAAGLRGALLMTGSTYVSFLVGLLVSALVARALGPTEFGRYAYLVWLSGFLVLLANNGLTTTLIRFVSESIGRDRPETAAGVHAKLLRWQLGCLGLTLLAFVSASPWAMPSGWESQAAFVVAAIVASVLGKALYLFDISAAKGHGQYSVEALCTVAISLANAVAVIGLVLAGAGLLAYCIVFALASVAYAVLAALLLRRKGVRAMHGGIDAELMARIRQHLFWTVVLTVVGAFANKSVETFLLNLYVGPAEVGFFTIAVALTRGGSELLSSGLNSVLMPAMAHAHGVGGAVRVNAMALDAVRYFGFTGLVLAGVGFLWAEPAVALLYGSGYEPATDALRVLVVVAGLTLPQSVFGALLTTTDHQRLRATIAGISLVLAAAAAIYAVPRYGLTGAVIANATAGILTFLAIATILTRRLSMRLPWAMLGGLFASAAFAAAAAASLLWWHAGLAAYVAAGLVYAAILTMASLRLGAWSGKDFAQMEALAARHPRSLGWLARSLRGRVRS